MKALLRTLLLLLIAGSLIFLSGCRFVTPPAAPTPFVETPLPTNEGPEAAYTAAVQTVMAELTKAAMVEATSTPTVILTDTPLPLTPTPLPTDTPGPSLTPSATPSPTASATPTGSSTPQPTVTPELVFQDDFSVVQGWFTAQTDRFSFEYKNGTYQITNNILNYPIVSVRSFDYADVQLEVDAARIGGPTNGYFGLTCRFKDNGNYYGLVIGSNGFYSILRLVDGNITFLDQGIAKTDKILPGYDVNHLKATCIGNTLSLSANGNKLLEVQDDTYKNGFVGFVVGTTIYPGERVKFDDFMIYKP